MQNIYGVISEGVHTDVSMSLKGAKRFATLNEYTIVSVRYNAGYIVEELFKKENNKWVKIKNK